MSTRQQAARFKPVVYGEFSKQRADSKPSAFGACASFVRLHDTSTVSFPWKYFVSLRSFYVSIFVILFSSRKRDALFTRLNFDVQYRDYCEWRNIGKIVEKVSNHGICDHWPLTRYTHYAYIYTYIYEWLKLLVIVQMLKKFPFFLSSHNWAVMSKIEREKN